MNNNVYDEKEEIFKGKEKAEIKNIVKEMNIRQFTTEDIKKFRKELDTVIIAPYNENQVKGVGYNLTASNMIYSLSKHKLLKIQDSKEGKFFYLSAHDTALILTNEYFDVSNNVAGSFYSRVRRVSEGLGQISTTLDPGWKGMFLISLNNSTNKTIKVQISSKSEGQENKIGIATVVLTGTVNKNGFIDDNINLDNPAMRIDILKELVNTERVIFNKYKHNSFKSLVNQLDTFTPEANPIHDYINKIKKELEDIDNALMYEKDPSVVKKHINSLNWFSYEENQELKRKINELNEYLTIDNYQIIDDKSKEIKEKIDKLKKECDYILLCENVSQIHSLIDGHIEKYNKYSNINSLLTFAIKHKNTIIGFIVSVISTIIIAILLFKSEKNLDLYEKIILIITPVFTTLISNLIGKLFKW